MVEDRISDVVSSDLDDSYDDQGGTDAMPTPADAMPVPVHTMPLPVQTEVLHGVGYRKKGYPKQEPKILLKPCKNQSRKTTARSQQISPIRPRPCAEASCERQKAPRPTEALSPRPSR